MLLREHLADGEVVFRHVDVTTAGAWTYPEPLCLRAFEGPVGDADLPRVSARSRARRIENLILGGHRRIAISYFAKLRPRNA